MKKIIPAFLLLILSFSGISQKLEISDFSIGETIDFKSDIMEEDRIVNIYLPESYNADSSKVYPVIYLLDGSADEDFIHISGLVQFCSFSWINVVPECIVVGIANVDRKRDFTYPSSVAIDREEFPTSGHSAEFVRFIGEELQPMIENEYKVSDEKTLIGQSLGGLLATEILFSQPELFDNYIIVSPSLWWDNEKLLEYDLNEESKEKTIYVGVGKEGDIMERLARSLYKKLNPNNSPEKEVYFGFFEKRNHGDALHDAVYEAFEKIFEVRSESVGSENVGSER